MITRNSPARRWRVRGLWTVVCGLIGAPSAWALERADVHFWFPDSVSTFAPKIDGIFMLILWITGIVFLLVEGALLWFLIHYRQRDGRKATYIHGNNIAEIIWTVIPALVVIYLAVCSQRVWSEIQGPPPPHQVEVQVTAEQFAWNFTYAGPDGKLGTADDVQTINQFHVPIGQVVLVDIKSKDVIHSFFLPQFRIKRDAVPGLTSRIWLQATKTGNFEVVCAELCGLGHYRMRGFVTVETPEAFAAWIAEKQQKARAGT